MALACVALLIPSGCNIPKLFCAQCAPPLPETYRGETSPDNLAMTGIAEFFNDPVLTELVTVRLAQNQELKIRNQEIWIANNEIMARRGAYLPFLFGSARGGFERNSRFLPLGAAEDQLTYPGGGVFPDPMGRVGLGLNFVWELDIWRKLRNARDAAIQRYGAAIERRNYLVTQLVAETAENYYELLALDKRVEFLNQTIEIQQKSLEVARAQKEAARGTELGVQRFLAEVRKNESQRLIFQQQIIEVENKINVLVGRYPQAVERGSWNLIDLDTRALNMGVPAELLLNRRDVQAAEREVAASGLDIYVARANFYPRLTLFAGVGYEAFNPKYLFDPGAFVANAAGELVGPVINKLAIRAEYMNANARQLQAIYNYQRTLINAYTEVVNNMSKVQNYRGSVEIKQQQVQALESSVNVSTDLFQRAFPEVEYMDVLFAQRDLLEARIVLIETKQQQLSAIVRTYQALGGGFLLTNGGETFPELFCQPSETYALGEDPVANTPEPIAPGDETPDAAVPQEKSEPEASSRRRESTPEPSSTPAL